MTDPRGVDLIVVGAGTAGAATAAFAAEAGMRVVCLERRPLADAGARWVNGVTRWALAEVGITPREGVHAPPRFHLIAGRHRVTVDDHDVLDLDMRALVAQWQARAVAAGAELRGEVCVHGRDGDTVLSDGDRLRARWIVDASGLAGLGLVPGAPIAPEHLCAAAQGVYALGDPAGAAAYFERLGVGAGEIAAQVGIAGGFSVLNVRVHASAGTVAVLTGSIPATGQRGGKAIRDDFARSQPWIGPMIYGGSGAIPLRRPREELTDGTAIAVGDTGCQVFPAHGSGIGAGMIAAKLLIETLASGGTPFDYEVAWHRRWGGLFAAYDAVRRWNQRMSAADLEQITADGLFDGPLARAGLDQTRPPFDPIALARKLPAAARRPEVLALGARTVAVMALGAQFPPRGARRRVWSAAMQRLLPV